MTIGVGLIISKYNKECVDNIRKKYGLALVEISNSYVDAQLFNEEVFLQVTECGTNSLTGVGCFALYTKDLSFIRQGIDDENIAEMIIRQIEETRKVYKEVFKNDKNAEKCCVCGISTNTNCFGNSTEHSNLSLGYSKT